MSNTGDRLQEKLDDEFDRYMNHVRRLPAGEIFQHIEEIAAMMDVYTYMTKYADFDSKEIAWILSTDSPLRELCEQWLTDDKDISDSLNEALWSLCDPPELSEDDEADEDEAEYEQGDDD